MKRYISAVAALALLLLLVPSASDADSSEFVKERKAYGASLYSGLGWTVNATIVCPEGYEAVSGGYWLQEDDETGIPPTVDVTRNEGGVRTDGFPDTVALADHWNFTFTHGDKYFAAYVHATCVTD